MSTSPGDSPAGRRWLWQRLGLDIDPLWFISCLLAAGFFLAAAELPLWKMDLFAPQYPAGLTVTAYGTRMMGDLSEVNSLNHYIGAMVIQPESISELVLFPYALGAIIGALLFASVVRCPPALRLLLSLGVWSFPVGLLVDLQWWLYRFGHELDENAPMRALVTEGFTPRVLGHTHVINFETYTGVSIGFWMMVAGAAVPGTQWLIRFLRDSWRNTNPQAGAAALLLVAMLGVALAPRSAEAASTDAIAQAIARTAPGGVATIPAGVYHEQVVIDRPITLVGEGAAVIDGGGRGDVVTIRADNVTLRGFTIQGSGRDVADEPAGIRVVGARAIIEDNRLQDVLYGIWLAETGGHLVRNNYISSFREYEAERRGHALQLWYTDHNTLEGNVIDFVKDGIFVGFASDNVIERNSVQHGRYGIHYMYADRNRFIDNTFRDNVAGGAIMFSRRIVFSGNEFSGNRSPASGFGLLFKDVDDVEMVGNQVRHNRVGITMEGAPQSPQAKVVVRDNVFAFNQVGLDLATNTAVAFRGNAFIGNLTAVALNGTGGNVTRNSWSADGSGNYWDGYRGYDARGDGIGDLPFVLSSAYEDLVGRHPALKVFSFTPAHAALDLAAQWFPAFRGEPIVTDRDPLMRPGQSPRLAAEAAGGLGARLPGLLGMLGLVLVPAALVAALAVRGSRSAWRPS